MNPDKSQLDRLKCEIAEVMTEIDNLTSVEESKTTQRNKQIAMGRKKFNMDPKKDGNQGKHRVTKRGPALSYPMFTLVTSEDIAGSGIQFLIENDLLQNTPEDIAQFLYKGEGLNKTVIGDYLGERDDFNIQVLQAFVELHEFADLNLVQALRQFLWSFRLPGEAQKIDRMMEAFASRYCLCNPGVFQSTDTCYVLSFAIIMLNTSLHNPNVRDKPSVERFISMNRGINEGGDLPEELLRICCNLSTTESTPGQSEDSTCPEEKRGWNPELQKNGETKVAELARLLRANSANGKNDTQSSWSAETKHLRYVSKV
ncbi:unnamed protein product [Ranitomeya imitator]|uniref:SEC7 domain-containing protein n=1 Tax=Ranitomeya imitator TaxID=111125 RepID=A0ABN9LHY3_9NEOB|nr:unnamed protein product [Ranitomeya imitator]